MHNGRHLDSLMINKKNEKSLPWATWPTDYECISEDFEWKKTTKNSTGLWFKICAGDAKALNQVIQKISKKLSKNISAWTLL